MSFFQPPDMTVPEAKPASILHVVTTRDLQWGRPIFKAPSLESLVTPPSSKSVAATFSSRSSFSRSVHSPSR